MVVESRPAASDLPAGLDLAYAGLFLGLRVNELVANRLSAAGFEDVRESHGYVLQHLIEGDRSITELAGRMEVTQQAASKVVAELISLGILETATGDDRRAKRIRLSKRGWHAVQSARRARRLIEKRLLSAVGSEPYETTRTILLACLQALGGIQRVRTRRIRQPR